MQSKLLEGHEYVGHLHAVCLGRCFAVGFGASGEVTSGATATEAIGTSKFTNTVRGLLLMHRETLRRACANLFKVDALPVPGLNVYSILQRDQLIMTQPAVEAAVHWLSRPINQRFSLEMASSGLPIPDSLKAGMAQGGQSEAVVSQTA